MCIMIYDIQRAPGVLVYIQCYRLYSPIEGDTMSMDSTAGAACVSERAGAEIKHSDSGVFKQESQRVPKRSRALLKGQMTLQAA